MVRHNNIVWRADEQALIPDDVVAEVLKAAAQSSAELSLFRHVEMGTKYSELPMLSALAQAYFVNGDAGMLRRDPFGVL